MRRDPDVSVSKLDHSGPLQRQQMCACRFAGESGHFSKVGLRGPDFPDPGGRILVSQSGRPSSQTGAGREPDCLAHPAQGRGQLLREQFRHGKPDLRDVPANLLQRRVREQQDRGLARGSRRDKAGDMTPVSYPAITRLLG